MGLFGFGKKKKNEPEQSEDMNISLQDHEEPEGEAAAFEEEIADSSAAGIPEYDDNSEEHRLYNMGLDALDDGDGEAAKAFFTQAAEKGHAGACFSLGLMYESGDGIEADKELALSYYRKAAELGHAGAGFNYGYMLCSTDNEEEGLTWIKKAAQAGDDAAVEYLQSIENIEKEKQAKEELEQKRKAFISSLKGFTRYYGVISGLTRSPFIQAEDGSGDVCTHIFTDKAQAEAFCRSEENIPLTLTVLELTKQTMSSYYEQLYLYGMNSVDFHDGEDTYHVYLFEVAKRKNSSKNAKSSILNTENPTLQKDMLLFMQEFRVKKETPDIKFRQRLDRNMGASMRKAQYLMPYNEVTVKGKRAVGLVMLTNNINKDKLIPLFTDKFEFDRFRAGKPLKVLPMDYKKLSEMSLPEGTSGFLINPGGAAVSMPQSYIKKVLSALKESEKTNSK